MAVATPKPTLPESYKVPEVWTFTPQEGTMGGMNRPTAGKRSDEELPKGEHPIQLYSLGTPNGMKVTILLEEMGIEYDAWKIPIFDLKQFTSGFCEVNPNSKIPAMYDYAPEDGGDRVRVFESGAILMYLAEKYGMFLPSTARGKAECISWLMWQMGSAPSIGGGFGHFYKYAPVHIEYAVDRFSMETKRLVDVLDKHLEGKDYICGSEYTIADMAVMPWIYCIEVFYSATEFLQMNSYTNVQRWKTSLLARKAVKRGLRVNGFGDDKVEHRHAKTDFAADDYD
jgi:GST-like protein